MGPQGRWDGGVEVPRGTQTEKGAPVSAAPQESHDLPGCLVLLLGEKGASGGRGKDEGLWHTSALALSPGTQQVEAGAGCRASPRDPARRGRGRTLGWAWRAAGGRTCCGWAGCPWAGGEARAGGGRSGSAAG